MFITNQHLNNFSINTKDGELGKIDRFLFDDRSWAVRYIVVAFGFLPKVRKLISPSAVTGSDDGNISIDLTTEQLRESPDIDTDQPVSRQKEQQLHDHFAWPYYWGFSEYDNAYGYPLYPGFGYTYPFMLYADEKMMAQQQQRLQETTEPHTNLRSTKELVGYTVSSRSEEIGTIDDFILDTDLWTIRYAIVATGNFLPGKKLILAAHWTRDITWESSRVTFDVDITKNGPTFDSETDITRDFEQRLFDFYRKPYYWEQTEHSPVH